MLATCKDVRYQAGSYECVQSWSAKDPGYLSSLKEGGRTHVSDRGTGWADVVTPSKLILTVEIENGAHEIWIDRFFKKTVGRLTAKRRDLIRAAMPVTIEVERQVGRQGTEYYSVPEPELAAWLHRTGLDAARNPRLTARNK